MKINVTKDFNYFFSIRDHGQGRTLTVYSQFLGAKNPEEYQYKTQTNTPARGLEPCR
jgi:hypothetical protein